MKISKRTKFYAAVIIIGILYIPVSWVCLELVDSGFGKQAIDSTFTLIKSICGFFSLFIALYYLFKIDLENEISKELNYVKMPPFIRSMVTVVMGFLSLFPFYFWLHFLFLLLIH